MKKLIPFPPWPFGPKHPEFYLCKCEGCGFMRTYEVSDYDVISLDDTDKDSDSAFMQVKTLPKTCLKCSGKMKKTKIPSPIEPESVKYHPEKRLE